MGKCPLCRSPGKLYVASWERITCWDCGFHGGAAELYGALKGLGANEAVAGLVGQRALEAQDRKDLEAYQERVAWGYRTRALNRQWSERLHAHQSTILAILERRGLHLPHHLLARLIPHAAVLCSDDLLDITKPASRRGMGQRTWLGLGVFHDALLVGYWLIGQEDTLYCPLEYPDTLDPLPGVVGMGLTVRRGATTVVCEDPVAALRLIGRALEDEGELPSCVAMLGGPTPPWLVDGPRDLLWWGAPQNLQAIGQAIRTARAGAIASSKFCRGLDCAESPLPYSWREMVRRLGEATLDPARALVEEALAMPDEQSRAALGPVWKELTAIEQTRVLAACSAEDAQALKRRTGEDQGADRTITFRGKTIRETAEGWWQDATLVTQAVLRVEEIEPDGQGDGVARGVVVVRGTRLAFTEQLSKLRRNTADWLHGLVLDRLGRSNIVDRAYRQHLFDIAQLFWEPRPLTRAPATPQDGVLAFPGFTVDRQGLMASLQAAPGPVVPYPTPLSTLEVRSLSERGLIELVLALLGNFVRQARGLPALNLAVQEKGFVWERVAHQLGLPVSQHLEGPAAGYWPAILRCDDRALRGLFVGPQGPARAVTCGAATFACLVVHPSWLRLTEAPPAVYRGIRACLLGLPACLRADLSPESSTFYRDLAGVLHETLPGPGDGAGEVWRDVAGRLDDQTGETGRQLSTRLLRLAWAAQRAGALPPGGSGEVDWEAVRRAYSRSSAPLPPVEDVRGVLAASRCLGGGGPPMGGHSIQVDPVVWGLLGSLGG